MAQPVLCAGVGQGSDYVVAEPWGAAIPFHAGPASFLISHFLISICPQRVRVSRVVRVLRVRNFCTCKPREFPEFPVLTWTLATSAFAVAESFFPPSHCVCPIDVSVG